MVTNAVYRAPWFVLLVVVACGADRRAPELELPERPADAPGGAELAAEIRGLDFEAREERIIAEVARGNVPTWLRRLERVEIRGEAAGRQRRVTFWVTRDYLSIGSDDDYFHVPVSPRTAQHIADLVGASLPTPRMVDAVWAAASFRLNPIRIAPDPDMRTVPYFERHDRIVRAQRTLHGAPPGSFVAGHKLDVVATAAGEFALYGWHVASGRPIQPLFPIPIDRSPHFSLGIRLVDRGILIDGTRRDLADALRDPELAAWLRRVRAR